MSDRQDGQPEEPDVRPPATLGHVGDAADEGDAPASDAVERSKRTAEELERDMLAAVAGLTGIDDVNRVFKAAGLDASTADFLGRLPSGILGLAPAGFKLDIPGSAGTGDLFRGVDQPLVERMSMSDLVMPPPPANAEQLDRLHDATAQQGVYLSQIVEIMAESVTLSREATEAAKATAQQAGESQRVAQESIRVAKASVWLVVIFGLVQVGVSVLQLVLS